MQKRSVFFFSLMALGLVIAMFQYIAHVYFLYWVWWWTDILMHFLGGVFIAGCTLWFVEYEIPRSWRRQVPHFFVALLAILVVGVAWEVFEWVTGMYTERNYSLDTTMDLAMDVVGMLTAYLLFKKLS